MPIGNDRDITLRLIDTAKEAAIILCESKAVSQRVLKRAGLPLDDSKFIEINEHNEADCESVLSEIETKSNYQASVLYTSDSGMPVFEDPGSMLTDSARNRGWKIEVLPGPNALTSALTFCGLNEPFTFLGFPPREKKDRKHFFTGLKAAGDTVVFYEAPYRIASVVDGLMQAGLQKRQVRVVVDLTGPKQYYFEGRVEELKKEQIPKGPPVFILLSQKH